MTDLDFQVRVASKFMSLKASAASRGIKFGLTLAGVSNLLRAKKCYYTGVPITAKNFSVDRKCASLGYVTGNIVTCDTRINTIKSNLTIKEIEMLYKKTVGKGK